MRIIIDMQGAQTPGSSYRGVGRYSMSLAKAMLKNSHSHEIFLALNGAFSASIKKIRDEFCGLIPNNRIVVWQQFYPFTGTNPKWIARRDAAEISREIFLNSFNPDVIFSPNLQEGLSSAAVTSVKKIDSKAIYVTTLHNLIPLSDPEKYLGDLNVNTWYLDKISQAIDSDVIIASSQHSRDEIISRCVVDLNKIDVVYCAVDQHKFKMHPVSSRTAETILKKHGVKSPFFLYTGGVDIHKNLDRLYQAFARLPDDIKQTYQLVMVGKELKITAGVEYAKLRSLGIAEQVVYPGYISDDDLIALYNLCYLFVFPSTHEGFGLPILEAMSCGAALLCSNTSSPKEINTFIDATFDPYDVDDISQKITKAVQNAQFYQSMKAFSVSRVSDFSWENSAKHLLTIMEKAVHVKSQDISHPPYKPIDEIINLIANSVHATELKSTEIAAIAKSIAETYPDDLNRCSRLYLDVSAIMINDDGTGIQRVTRALCNVLVNQTFTHLQIFPVYKTPTEEYFHLATTFLAKAVEGKSPFQSDMVIDFIPGDTLFFLDLHPAVAISYAKNIRYLKNKGVKVLHLVHDLLPLQYPDYFHAGSCREFNLWIETILKSSGIICVSQAVVQQLKFLIKERQIRVDNNFSISWSHNGADIQSSLPTKGLPIESGRVLSQLTSTPTFLMVGTLEPRKKHQQALDACDILWKKGYTLNLVFVGKEGWKTADLIQKIGRHEQRNKQLFWLNHISDDYLTKIYEASSCLIAASVDEGFGLPLIEAARYKLPIMARDIPVFREVAGQYAYYFTGFNAQDLADAIVNWLNLQQQGKAPLSDGMPWLTWEQSGQQLLKAIFPDEEKELFV